MKIGIRAGILSLMMILAGLSAWGAVSSVQRSDDEVPAEVYAWYHAKSARAQFLLGRPAQSGSGNAEPGDSGGESERSAAAAGRSWLVTQFYIDLSGIWG